MRILRTIVLLTISIVSVGLVQSPVTAQNAPISIVVNPEEPGIRVPSDFVGFSYETSDLVLLRILDGDNATVARLYSNLGEGVIRVGGNSLDTRGLDNDSKGAIDGLIAFSKSTGWRLIIGLPLGKYDPSAKANLADYIYRNAGGQLVGFEVGNEPDLFSRNGIRNQSYSFSDYLREFNGYYDETRERVPEAPFVGPATASHIDDWLEPFASSESSRVAFLTQHYYALGPAGDPTVTTSLLLSSDTRDREVKTATSLAGISKKYNVSIRMGETNSVYNGGQAGVSDVFASALWGVDYMFTLASYGIIGVNFHTPPSAKYAAIATSDGDYFAAPLYYGMLLFKISSNGRFIPLEQGGPSININSYAILQDDGTIVVTIINKETEGNAEIQLSTEDAYKNATSVLLTAPSLQSQSGITIGGSEVTGNDAWQISKANEIKVSGTDGQFELTLPPACAVSIFLTTSSSSLNGGYWSQQTVRNVTSKSQATVEATSHQYNQSTSQSIGTLLEEQKSSIIVLALLSGCLVVLSVSLRRIVRLKKSLLTRPPRKA
jgi:hypothetical protein